MHECMAMPLSLGPRRSFLDRVHISIVRVESLFKIQFEVLILKNTIQYIELYKKNTQRMTYYRKIKRYSCLNTLNNFIKNKERMTYWIKIKMPHFYFNTLIRYSYLKKFNKFIKKNRENDILLHHFLIRLLLNTGSR